MYKESLGTSVILAIFSAIIILASYIELHYGYANLMDFAGIELVVFICLLTVRIRQYLRMKENHSETWLNVLYAVVLCLPVVILLPVYSAVNLSEVFQSTKHFASQIRRVVIIILYTFVPITYFIESLYRKLKLYLRMII